MTNLIHHAKLITVSLALIFLVACQNNKRPDLGRLYLDHATDFSNTPLIVIHGTMGSKLRHKETHEEMWIGNLKKLAFSNYRDLALEINPATLNNLNSELEAFEILDSVSGVNFYENLIQVLTEVGGYQLNKVHEPIQPGRPLYLFNYDWRQDNVVSAQKLSQFIDDILIKHPSHQKVDVVAHSMGGLIARYYMRYGDKDVLDGNIFTGKTTANKIRHAIFLGTPNLGSVLTVNRFINGFNFNLRTIPIDVLATMPSIYQLLPYGQHAWLFNTHGQAIPLDAYSPKMWQDNQWAVYDPIVQENFRKQFDDPALADTALTTLITFFNKQLERARRFAWALSVELKGQQHEFIVFGGDCNMTTNKLVIENIDGQNHIRYKPQQITHPVPNIDYRNLMLSPGDGQVTKSSLLARFETQFSPNFEPAVPIKYPIFLCENHLKLTRNLNFQDNLLHILLQ
ncbi:lipase/acyltransferase domain-containing protein [Marinicella rhabdoformis]|uniref:lipase/acyltransferase domain-containing protein n=1 Tax=Marinicella rhabdoformis TaxID=2580566 RepID=UPI0012AECF73|nr:hypothetical protein [Marinicella rhabdoformis]